MAHIDDGLKPRSLTDRIIESEIVFNVTSALSLILSCPHFFCGVWLVPFVLLLACWYMSSHSRRPRIAMIPPRYTSGRASTSRHPTPSTSTTPTGKRSYRLGHRQCFTVGELVRVRRALDAISAVDPRQREAVARHHAVTAGKLIDVPRRRVALAEGFSHS